MLGHSKRNRSVIAAASTTAAAVLAVSGVAASVRASTIAYWNFNDAVANSTNWLTVDAGTGTMATSSTNLSSTAGTTTNALTGTVAGNAIGFDSKTNGSNATYTWSASTASLSDVWFSFAGADTGGYTGMQLSYSTNGTTFTNLGSSQATPGSTFTAQQYDLTSITALNNNANTKFRLTLTGASNGAGKFFYLDNVQVNSGNDSQITVGTASFGRVMQGSTASITNGLTKAGFLGTSYTVTSGSTGMTATGDGSIGTGNQTENITLQLVNNANGSASTGAKSFNVTVDNTASTSFGSGLGSADADDSLAVSGTVVANRVVDSTAVSFGRRMVGVSLAGNTSSLSTIPDDNNATRVTVATTAAANADGVTVASGTGTAFNSSTSTGSRSLAGSFSSSGLKNNTITLTTTGEGLSGEAPVNVAISYTATALTNRVVSASSVSLGRVMVGTSVSGGSNLTTTLDNNNATAVTVASSTGADANGISVTGGSGSLFNSAASTGTRTVAGTFSTSGSKSNSLTMTTTGEGLTGEVAVNVPVSYTATALQNRQVSASSVSLGRRMIGTTLSGTSNLSTTLDNLNATAVTVATTAGANADGVTVASGTGTSFNAAASTGTRSLGGSFSTTGSKSSSVTLVTTGEGIAGEAPINVNVPYTAVALANRVVSASSLNFGSRLVGTTVSGTSNLSTTLDNNNATAVTVATTAGANADGISIASGTGTSFNGVASTGTRSAGGSFATSGNKSNSVTLTTTGEGLSGEAPINVAVNYTSSVYQPASVSANTPGPLGNGGTATITNAASSDGGQRASAYVDHFSVSGNGFGVTGLAANVTNSGSTTNTSKSINAGVTFASAGKLNGTHNGSLAIGVENDQSITGTSNLDLNSGNDFTWSLSQVVSGNSGSQSSVVAAGTDLGNLGVKLNGVSDQELGSVATLLDSNALSAQRTLAMSWRARTAAEKFPTGTTPPLPANAYGLVSDVVDFSNTGSDAFVLQMSYDESQLVLTNGETEATAAAEGLIYLAYLNGGVWQGATLANSSNAAPGSLQNFQGSYAASGANMTLGAYGVDTANNTVWAVLDHNSEFAAIPEPTGLALLGAGAGLLAARRRRRSA